MTTATSVPQSSNPPPCEGLRGLWSLVSAEGIHLRRSWARVSGTSPHGRSLGRPLEPRGPGLGIFPGALSGPRHPPLPRECPRRPLTPAGHLHPAISGSPPPWGSDTWGRGASKWPTWRETPQTPPSRPHHCEDPPVLPSVKGYPFTDGRTGGRPPGDGSCPSCGWVVSGQEAGPPRRRQAPPPLASLGQRAPPLRYQARFPGSLGWCPGKRKPSLPPRGPRVFSWTTLPSRSPTPA